MAHDERLWYSYAEKNGADEWTIPRDKAWKLWIWREGNLHNRQLWVAVIGRTNVNSDVQKTLTEKNKVIIDSKLTVYAVCNPNLLMRVQQVPDDQVEPHTASRIACKIDCGLLLRMGSGRIILKSVFLIPGLNLNIISCSRLDGSSVTTIVENRLCCSTSRHDVVVFVKI